MLKQPAFPGLNQAMKKKVTRREHFLEQAVGVDRGALPEGRAPTDAAGGDATGRSCCKERHLPDTGHGFQATSAADQASIHLAVDSTGLKIFGDGAWLEEKQKTNAKRKSWRKPHLGLDLVIAETVCSDLTTDDIGDPTALSGLLYQVNGSVDLFLAAGAYDGNPTYDLLAARFGSMTDQERSIQSGRGAASDLTRPPYSRD